MLLLLTGSPFSFCWLSACCMSRSLSFLLPLIVEGRIAMLELTRGFIQVFGRRVNQPTHPPIPKINRPTVKLLVRKAETRVIKTKAPGPRPFRSGRRQEVRLWNVKSSVQFG
jgi:hypothetical protein